MNKENSFFVGWKDDMPKANRSLLIKFIVVLFISIPLLTFLIVKSQKPFNNHIFEFGNVKEFTGIYHADPVPILEVTDNKIPEGFSNYVLLVGFGKFGAEGIISNIEKSSGPLNGLKVTLQGTLIYGDGRYLMELTKKEDSLIKIFDEPTVANTHLYDRKKDGYSGEILDPKCYFGVMKPGEGKIHKSCAIRCISGGIPPVFRANIENGQYEYFLLLGPNGEKINKAILNDVAELVTIDGETSIINGWPVLYANPSDIIRINKKSYYAQD